MRIMLHLTDKTINPYDFDIQPALIGSDYEIYMVIDPNKSFSSQIRDKSLFYKYMEETASFSKFDEDFKSKKEIKFIDENYNSIFKYVNYISPDIDTDTFLKYLKSNPELLTKKIYLGHVEITEFDSIVKEIKRYSSVIDNVYVSLENDDNPTKLLDCYKVVKKIKETAEVVKKLNLSPIERIMYIYDLSRNRIYTKEDDYESPYKSRELTKVLSGDKIVCVGYAKIFNVLLKYAGINSRLVDLEPRNSNKKVGHCRNVIHVVDKKYNIDGVYFFDPTWDSKRNENDNYLGRYNFFARTKKHMDDYEKNTLCDIDLRYYSEDLFDRVKELVDSGNIKQLEPLYETIRWMFVTADKKCPLKKYHFGAIDYDFMPQAILKVYPPLDKVKFLRNFKTVCKKYKKEIKAETFFQIAQNVRKIEYYIDSDSFPYNDDTLFKMSYMYAKHGGIESEMNDMIGLIIKSDKSKKEIEQVKLAKTLRKVLETKQR